MILPDDFVPIRPANLKDVSCNASLAEEVPGAARNPTARVCHHVVLKDVAMEHTPVSDHLIQADEIRTALTSSGYLLEGRIAGALEREGFYVELNSFRADPRDETKPIEIDV